MTPVATSSTPPNVPVETPSREGTRVWSYSTPVNSGVSGPLRSTDEGSRTQPEVPEGCPETTSVPSLSDSVSGQTNRRHRDPSPTFRRERIGTERVGVLGVKDERRGRGTKKRREKRSLERILLRVKEDLSWGKGR